MIMRHATYLSRLSLRALGLSPALLALTTPYATFACSSPVDFGERADGGAGGSGGSAGSVADSSGSNAATGGTDGSTGGDGSGCADGCATGGSADGTAGNGSAVGGAPATGGNGSAVGGGPADAGGTGSAVGGGPASTGGTGSAVGGGPASGGAPGGTGGTGGTSTPPTPAAVGFSLTLSPPDPDLPNVGARSCPAGTGNGFTYVIGAPAPGKTIEGGTNGVDVECIVVSSSTLSGDINAMGTFYATASGVEAYAHKPITISVAGEVLDKAAPEANAGGLTFFSPDTSSLTTLDGFPGCTIGPVATLKSGAILTDIDCPLIGSVDDTTSGCKVHGTIAFEYCKAGPCGDGVIQGPEECDEGDANSDFAYGGCNTHCQLGPHCGDGVVNGAEECDEGSGNGAPNGDCTDGCRSTAL